MTPRSLGERVIARAYRALLYCYSSSFRDGFATDMQETFIDRYRVARAEGAAAAAGFLAHAATDAITNGLRERFSHQLSGLGMFNSSDIRYAFRLLRRSPLFTLLTVVTLSGGLGLSIFTFSFLHTAMVKPLPLDGGDRIVRLETAVNGTTRSFDVVDLAVMRKAMTTVTHVGAFDARELMVGDERHRRVLSGTAAESNIFDATRTRPALGRGFRPEDQAAGAEPVIVLSDWAWRVAFGGDTAIVDTRIPMNGGFTRVIGVMPPGYGFPVASEAWVPLGAEVLAGKTAGINSFDLYARLANGVSSSQAAAELGQLLERAQKGRLLGKDEVRPSGAVVRPFPMAQFGEEGPMILAVLNLLATLILLLACINVTNLLLARANEHARETAVRLALGASRGRLVMQSMWENIVLCLLGGVLATAIAAWGLDAINAWMQNNLQRNLAFWWVWRMDRAAIVAAGAFVTITIAVLGGVVSARVSDTEFNTVLRDGGARAGGRREGRVARTLVITQVATVSLLMFFGVMSSIVAYRVTNMEVGYDTHRLLSSGVWPSEERFPTSDKRSVFYQSLADGMVQQPSVNGTLLRSHIGTIRNDKGAFSVGAAPTELSAVSPHAYVDAVLGQVSLTGVTALSGRLFDGRDDERGERVAIVSQALANKYWPGQSPLGRQLRVAGATSAPETRTVVGVATNVLLGTPLSRNRSAQAIYIPLRQSDAPDAVILFKHRGDATAAQAALYQALSVLDPRMLAPDVSTYDEILEKSSLIAKSVTKLFALCFGFALLLAVSGTYGLMARSIGQRTREIGIRRALGATDRSVVQLLLGQGSRQLGVGVLIAMPLMLLVGVGFWQFFPIGLGVSIATGLLVGATIVAVVLLATYVPTRQVLNIPPRDALWRE